MPPTSDGIRTVGCSLLKLVPDAHHLNAIQHAVASTHKSTILATELLNIHMRRMLVDDPNFDFLCFFNSSWILNAYNEVTSGKQNLSNTELRKTLEMYMPPFSRPDRTGIQQCLLYDLKTLYNAKHLSVFQYNVHPL